MNFTPTRSVWIPFLLAPFISSCTTLGYLIQAGRGQLAIINRARPLEEVIKDETTPPRIKKLLQEVPAIKNYGEKNFELKATSNYQEYVHWDQDAVLWVVTGCRPLKFEPKEWTFPVVGSMAYLGFFDESRAWDFSKGLAKEGWDVDVRPAGAYSTLGWFKDPILSTMISDGDSAMGYLVNVVLHESVHASLYIDHQSFFNESVASFAADKMAFVYLADRFGKKSVEFESHRDNEQKWEDKKELFRKAYEALEKIYSGSDSESQKVDKKNKILQDLKAKTKAKREITNATLIGFKTYGSGMKGFETLYRACGENWTRFWKVLREKLEKNPDAFGKKQQDDLDPILEGIAKSGCG